MNRRVVVTGMGMVSPLGLSIAEAWDGLLHDRSGVSSLPADMPECRLHSRVCGQVPAFDEKAIAPRKQRRNMGRVSLLACLAAQQAAKQAKLSQDMLGHTRTGICAGSTTGSSAELDRFFGEFHHYRDIGMIEATAFMKVMNHTVASALASHLGVCGQVLSPASACATATQAIGLSMQMIRHGLCDVMICGGADELHETTIGVFDIVRAASANFNDTPAQTPRPFDTKRDGTVISEGAGILVLEAEDHAKSRGAATLGYVRGVGGACHFGHPSDPDPQAMQQCMQTALQDADLPADAIDYVNAHATGTAIGDPVEARATAHVLGENVPVSGTKGYTGHTLAASGAIEAIFCLLMMQHSQLIRTRNLDSIAEDCKSLHHLREHRRQQVHTVMSNSFAFGGVNSSLILQHADT